MEGQESQLPQQKQQTKVQNLAQQSQNSERADGQNLNKRPRLSSEFSQQQEQTKQQDKKSVFLENVDYGTTREQLQQIFEDCGEIVRITILKNPVTNKPKGNAYIEFVDNEAADNAIHLSGTMLRNRQIKVQPKRTNVKGMGKATGRGPIGGLDFLTNIISRGKGNWRGTRGRPK